MAVVGCTKDAPPRSVNEFVENPILLEAAMVRCAEDRAKSRYEAECVNARLAVSRIQAREEAERAAVLEEESKRKREALRRQQEAAAEIRRRAAEVERLRKEAEYLAQFGIMPGAESEATAEPGDGEMLTDEASPDATDVSPDAEAEPQSSDLEAVREELQRRNEKPGG
ncbi:MAG: hypothetical protein KJO46_10425 [Gammaproteobacteria bacterium]|nr:hypothetical protein [Gammaproteobacteria bacterium]